MALIPFTAQTPEEFADMLTEALVSDTVKEVAITARAYLGYVATLAMPDGVFVPDSAVSDLLRELNDDKMFGVPMLELYAQTEGAYQAYLTMKSGDVYVLELPTELVPEMEFVVLGSQSDIPCAGTECDRSEATEYYGQEAYAGSDNLDDADHDDSECDEYYGQDEDLWRLTEDATGRSIIVNEDDMLEALRGTPLSGPTKWTVEQI